MSARLVLAVLHEALATFGSITSENHAEVTKWVMQRVKAAHEKPGLQRDVDKEPQAS